MNRSRISPLKLYIIERGLRQVDIAAVAGISETRLNRILNGRSPIREYERKAIARALKLSTEELPV